MSAARGIPRPRRPAGAGGIAVSFARAPRPAELAELTARGTDLFELRLDLAGVRSAQEASLLAETFAGHKMLATARSTAEGGAADNDALRLEVLSAAAPHACALDVELSSRVLAGQAAKVCRAHGCELVLSFHSYHATPSLDELRTMADGAFEAGADLFKAAVTISGTTDTDTLSSLLAAGVQAGRRLAVMGVGKGKRARESRLRLAREGSQFVFAHAGEPTADGQPNLDWLAAKLAQPV